MNKVFLIGNLTKDPEMSETSNGTIFCRISIAVNRPYSKDTEKAVDYFNITIWRNQAENCGKYLKKGSKVAVVGSVQNRSYEDKDGNKRQTTDIVAETCEFLIKSNNENSKDNDEETPSRPNTRNNNSNQIEMYDDDLPF